MKNYIILYIIITIFSIKAYSQKEKDPSVNMNQTKYV